MNNLNQGQGEVEQDGPIRDRSVRIRGKFLWENSAKLMILWLATQVAAVQASNNKTQESLVPEGNLTDWFSIMRTLDSNQTFPTVNTTPLGLNEHYVISPSSELDTLMHPNDSVGEKTATDDIVVTLLISSTDTRISNPQPYVLPISTIDISEVDHHDQHEGFREEFHQGILRQQDMTSANLQELDKTYKINVYKNNSLEESSTQTTLLRAVRSLPSVVDDLKGKTIEACISEISSGKIDSAIAEFKKINDYANYKLLSEIIEKVYYYKKPGFIQNIIDFVSKLPWLVHRAEGYKKLLDEMEKDEQLIIPKILILAGKVQEAIDKENKPDVKQESNDLLQYLKSKLAIHVNNIIDDWATRIRDDNYQQVLESIRDNCGFFVNNYWYQIIEKAYANTLSNAEKILKFIRSFPCINQTARCLSALFSQMKNNNHLNSHQLIMVAYKIKGELDFVNNNPNFPYGLDGHQYYKTLYESLKYNLPSSVIGLIWNGNSCTIRNRERSEYLFASRVAYSSDKRYVFTWIPGNVEDDDNWEIKAHNYAKSFTIRNIHRNEYLYAAGIVPKFTVDRITEEGVDSGLIDDDENDKRYVFTWINYKDPVAESYWELEPMNNGEFFTIRNTHLNEYLYSDGKYQNYWDKRHVFTLRWDTTHESKEQKRQWNISC